APPGFPARWGWTTSSSGPVSSTTPGRRWAGSRTGLPALRRRRASTPTPAASPSAMKKEAVENEPLSLPDPAGPGPLYPRGHLPQAVGPQAEHQREPLSAPDAGDRGGSPGGRPAAALPRPQLPEAAPGRRRIL